MKTITERKIGHGDYVKISQNMIKYGGSFAAALGAALLHADFRNKRKIITTWPDLCQKYLEI